MTKNSTQSTGSSSGIGAAGKSSIARSSTMRQRRALASSTTSSRENLAQNLMSYYVDDTPGLKLGPMTVLVMTLAYMSTVIVLHILGKFKEKIMG
ncbi:transport Sec61 subunit beta [Cryptosporidium sp. chipmunk genotype I]|uniref:transport Sec61 subunit beta n=1 Tax=Cryptosporidium sp. chipmunk genotype I TaxID=1280935 RepID=UPI00351AA533|nr:transport Sec61 subunit beta [Cryptosporidium sp. chipmunk genotype I]